MQRLKPIADTTQISLLVNFSNPLRITISCWQIQLASNKVLWYKFVLKTTWALSKESIEWSVYCKLWLTITVYCHRIQSTLCCRNINRWFGGKTSACIPCLLATQPVVQPHLSECSRMGETPLVSRGSVLNSTNLSHILIKDCIWKTWILRILNFLLFLIL